jgi:mannose-6-phosphate isomerase-like protein (cupin superfamily)
MIFGKIWGNTQKIFEHNNVSFHRIQILKGGICSKHYHEHKYNMFFVENGLLKISTWQKDYTLVDETILGNNQSTTISPGLYHNFEALEDTVAYEIYYLNLNDNDIIRDGCGYIKKDSLK